MVYQVLARKWRPKTFSEVIGQDHIARTLQNSILQQKIAQAYLFTGTRGVGKTTIARIFAKAIRCENIDEKGNPCLECSSCKSIDQANALDYVEIDGASNNSVDNVRELIENAQYLPSSGKYKVYVVDEVHMLSTSAFNALLKTLEEPPAHVVFIFATTDPHKLLGTVLSRCQRFDFKHVSQELLVNHIKKISEKEGISFDSDSSINILARQGDGSVRDTLSLMDQALSLSAGQQISEDILLKSLGLARADAIKDLTSSILACDNTQALKIFDEVTSEDVELEKFSNQLLDKLFSVVESVDNQSELSSLINNSESVENMDTAELLWVYESLLKDFEWNLQSFDPLRAMRFTLLKVCKRDEIIGSKKKSNNFVKKKTPQQTPVEESSQKSEVNLEQNLAEPEAERLAPIEANPEKVEGYKIPAKKSWEGFLEFTSRKARGLSMNLERASVLNSADGSAPEIILGFTEDEKIFQDFITENENHKKLNELAKEFYEGKSIFHIKTLDKETKEREQLYSNVEISEKKISDFKEAQEKRIRENKYIKEAQDLFNGEISKIFLKEED